MTLLSPLAQFYNISNNELVDTLSIVSSNLIVDDKYRLNIISDDVISTITC